jgi:hypothetical protein
LGGERDLFILQIFHSIRGVHTASSENRVSFPGIKRKEHGADYSPPSSAEVMNEWRCKASPRIRLHGVDRDKFTLFSKLISVVQRLVSKLLSRVRRKLRGSSHVYIAGCLMN